MSRTGKPELVQILIILFKIAVSSPYSMSRLANRSLSNFNGFVNGCSALTTLDVSNWHTGACREFNGFAFNCKNLTTLDVSTWDTGACTNFSYFVESCLALTAFDPQDWDVSSVTQAIDFTTGATSALTQTVLDSIYDKWSKQTVNPNVSVHFAANYSAAPSAGATGRGILTNATNNWTITDLGPI